MKKLLYIIIVLISSGRLASAQTDLENLWTNILQESVTVGRINGVASSVVDYGRIKTSPDFALLVDEVAKSNPDLLTTKNEKLAFWINVYNIATVKMITDHYPVKSIRTIGSLLSSVWNKDAINVGGKNYSLNEIEHEILRKMGEPRIHFAIVCASVSCPDLRNEAFSAAKLDTQLDEQVTSFLQNKQKGARIEADQKTVYLSSIFKWFEQDFGNVTEFVGRFMNASLENFKIKYMDYNWNLNAKEIER